MEQSLIFAMVFAQSEECLIVTLLKLNVNVPYDANPSQYIQIDITV